MTLSARQGEDTSWSSRPDHQYPFQYGHFIKDWERRRHRLFTRGRGDETSEGREQRLLLLSVPGQETGRGLRSVINLRGLNLYTKKRTFMMTTFKDVSQSIRKGDWVATIDLKDAYLHVSIARVTEGLSGSGGKAQVFSFAPRTITTISLPVVAMCRAKGIRLIAYLDNFLVLARNWRQLISHTSIVLDILDQAGFRQNLKKCHLQPRQKFEYLCLQLDSKELRVMLPADKITWFLSIRVSIESPSEDGSNISRQLWTWVEYIFVPFRYRWKRG